MNMNEARPGTDRERLSGGDGHTSALLTQIEMLLARISMAFLAGRNLF
jgi:hypothetical protein